MCVYNDIFYKVRIIFFYIFSNNTHLISFEKPQFYEIIEKANSALSLLSTSVSYYAYLNIFILLFLEREYILEHILFITGEVKIIL